MQEDDDEDDDTQHFRRISVFSTPGRKKALLIGIRYEDNNNADALDDCHANVNKLVALLVGS
jgi:hypothetical protein